MGFLPANFHLAMPFVLDLGSGTGQTNGRTDNGHHRIMPPTYMGGAQQIARINYDLRLHIILLPTKLYSRIAMNYLLHVFTVRIGTLSSHCWLVVAFSSLQ